LKQRNQQLVAGKVETINQWLTKVTPIYQQLQKALISSHGNSSINGPVDNFSSSSDSNCKTAK